MYKKISADDVDRLTAGVDFPAKIEEIMAHVDEADPAMDFFEAIQPGTTFESKEELISMVEQADSTTDTTLGDAGTRGEVDATSAGDALAEDDELF